MGSGIGGHFKLGPLSMLAIGGTLLVVPGCARPHPARCCANDNRSPAWIVEQYVLGRLPLDTGGFIAGELAEGRGSAKYSDPLTERPVKMRQLALSNDQAVYAVTTTSGRRTVDWYAYLVNEDSQWRLTTMRALAIPEYFWKLRDSLVSMSDQPDSLKADILSLTLTLSSDSVLRHYLVSERPIFDRIAAIIANDSAIVVRDSGQRLPAHGRDLPSSANAGKLDSLTRSVGVDWPVDEPEFPHCVLLRIGGVLDNSVGYLLARPNCNLPPMSPHRYIMLEHVIDAWYLFKTT